MKDSGQHNTRHSDRDENKTYNLITPPRKHTKVPEITTLERLKEWVGFILGFSCLQTSVSGKTKLTSKKPLVSAKIQM